MMERFTAFHLRTAPLNSGNVTSDSCPSVPQALVPDFQPAMEAYFEAVLALGRRVLRLLALALDLPPTW